MEYGITGTELNLFRHTMTGLHKRLTYTSAPLTHTNIDRYSVFCVLPPPGSMCNNDCSSPSIYIIMWVN